MSRTPTPLVDRLMAKVDVQPDGCWRFTGRLSREGYGRLWSGPGGKADFAHRLAFQEFRGAIPADKELDHLCRNTACCNPWHLEPVAPRVNKLRSRGFSAVNAAKTHCVNGHEFDPTNTRRLACGRRRCRTCDRDRARSYYARKAAS